MNSKSICAGSDDAVETNVLTGLVANAAWTTAVTEGHRLGWLRTAVKNN